MIDIGRLATVLTLTLVAGVHPVAAQVVDPQGCADIQEQVAYLLGEGAFVQDAGLKNGVDVLANAKMLRNAVCGMTADEPSAPTIPLETPPTPEPVPSPVRVPVAPADDDNSATRRDACLLLTVLEVGTAMKQGVVANEADPAGAPGAQGCEFNGVGTAFADVMYVQVGAPIIYDAFRSSADPAGVQTVPGLGDRAFTYSGGNGPGVVVAKGDKLFTIEFSGLGNGPSERSSLLALAQHALGRVH